MSDLGHSSLRQAWSPSKVPMLKSSGPSWAKPSFDSTRLGADQVSLSSLCLVVEQGKSVRTGGLEHPSSQESPPPGKLGAGMLTPLPVVLASSALLPVVSASLARLI